MNKEVTVNMPKEDFDKAVKSGVEQAMKECELTIGMTLKEAVEKQIPKKPKNEYTDNLDITTKIPVCPVCGNQSIDETDEYCSDCGQRLKWGD